MQEDQRGNIHSGEAEGSAGDPLEPLFGALGLSPLQVERAALRATRNGSRLEEELVKGGDVPEEALYRTMADLCGLDFLAAIPSEQVSGDAAVDTQLYRPMVLRLRDDDAPPRLALAPALKDFARHQAAFRQSVTRRRSHVVTTPSAIRRAVWEAGGKRRVRAVVNALDHEQPMDSASRTLVSWQAFLLGGCTFSLVIFAVFWPLGVAQAIHAFLTVIYAVTIMLRLASLFHLGSTNSSGEETEPDEEGMPVYTVLVALYREAGMIDQLLSALSVLDWPASRLDVKLVCEEDDHETLNALMLRSLAPHIEVVRVPPCPPRTKPKALDYALHGARGEFVTVYDAEDRPVPGQLREAWRRFRQEDDRLACLQAPLVIDGHGSSWIADLFAADYLAQFRGYLPMLDHHGWPIPLGGTSNHFRLSALRDSGGWDPYNVTEDADLGLRLARRGYRIGLLRTPTLENAPDSAPVWIRQRSRWMKGWLQTFLVALRQPRHLVQALGWQGASIAVITGAGTVLSALLYPAFFASLGLAATWAALGTMPPPLSLTGILLIMSGLNMVAGYGYYLFCVIAWHWQAGRPLKLTTLLRIPHLWLLLTVASWRAIWQLVVTPHAWEKTPHAPVPSEPQAKRPEAPGS